MKFPEPRPALRDAALCEDLCFALYVDEERWPIDARAREQVHLAMQNYPGAVYREIMYYSGHYSSETGYREIDSGAVLSDIDWSQFYTIGFPSLIVLLNGQMVHTFHGYTGVETICETLDSALGDSD